LIYHNCNNRFINNIPLIEKTHCFLLKKDTDFLKYEKINEMHFFF